MKDKLRKYIESNLKEKRGFFESVRCSFVDEECDFQLDNLVLGKYKQSNINDFIDDNKNKYSDFQTTLFKMIDERNLKDSDVYNKVHIDRRLFFKIRSDNNYLPSKDTIFF